MRAPVQITWRHLEPSYPLAAKIYERAEKLDAIHAGVTGCHVTVEAPHRHQHQRKLFHVRIELSLPGATLVVNREPAQHDAHADPFVAIRDAFDAARRRLDEYARRQRGETKVRAAG